MSGYLTSGSQFDPDDKLGWRISPLPP